jgi:hypothetical protein
MLKSTSTEEARSARSEGGGSSSSRPKRFFVEPINTRDFNSLARKQATPLILLVPWCGCQSHYSEPPKAITLKEYWKIP